MANIGQLTHGPNSSNIRAAPATASRNHNQQQSRPLNSSSTNSNGAARKIELKLNQLLQNQLLNKHNQTLTSQPKRKIESSSFRATDRVDSTSISSPSTYNPPTPVGTSSPWALKRPIQASPPPPYDYKKFKLSPPTAHQGTNSRTSPSFTNDASIPLSQPLALTSKRSFGPSPIESKAKPAPSENDPDQPLCLVMRKWGLELKLYSLFFCCCSVK